MNTTLASLSLCMILAAGCASTTDRDTAAAVQADYDQPGFVTDVVDGRLWIFRADSAELEEYRSMGEPAKHVIRVGAGPNGMTVKGPDGETIDAYLKAAGL
jgi:hypothetical protein